MMQAPPFIRLLRPFARLAQPGGIITGASADTIGTVRHMQVAAVICA
jgi:hypothetical protein